jgi:hypothetical protein
MRRPGALGPLLQRRGSNERDGFFSLFILLWFSLPCGHIDITDYASNVTFIFHPFFIPSNILLFGPERPAPGAQPKVAQMFLAKTHQSIAKSPFGSALSRGNVCQK